MSSKVVRRVRTIEEQTREKEAFDQQFTLERYALAVHFGIVRGSRQQMFREVERGRHEGDVIH